MSRRHSAEQDAELEAKKAEAKQAIDNIMKNEPKGIFSGLRDGVGAAIGGVVAGATVLVAAPVVGLAKGGIPGFIGGVGAGVIGAITLPVSGILIGTIKVGQGIKNTPDTVRKYLQKNSAPENARKMDENEESKVDGLEDDIYNESRKFVDEETSKNDKKPAGDKKKPAKDLEYYEILEVPEDADASQIRKAYRKKALQYHPDKNPNDAVAEEMFKKVSEAYQTLSDPELRKAYDEHGKEGVEPTQFADPSRLFAMVFGSDKFEHLVGKLAMASAAEFRNESGNVDEAELKRAQDDREQMLYENLIARLNDWLVEDEREMFIVRAIDEANDLKRASFGPELLQTIGSVYVGVGERCLGYLSPLGIFGRLGYFSEGNKEFSAKFKAAQAATKLVQIDQNQLSAELNHFAQDGGNMEHASDFLKTFFGELYAINVIDIESTLRKVCKRALKDKSVSEDIRRERCNGLIKLGTIFLEA